MDGKYPELVLIDTADEFDMRLNGVKIKTVTSYEISKDAEFDNIVNLTIRLVATKGKIVIST